MEELYVINLPTVDSAGVIFIVPIEFKRNYETATLLATVVQNNNSTERNW